MAATHKSIVVEVEVIQFNGGNFKEVFQFVGNGDMRLKLRRFFVDSTSTWQTDGHIMIKPPGVELEEALRVNLDDVILKKPGGEIEVLTPAEFTSEYEPI